MSLIVARLRLRLRLPLPLPLPLPLALATGELITALGTLSTVTARTNAASAQSAADVLGEISDYAITAGGGHSQVHVHRSTS